MKRHSIITTASKQRLLHRLSNRAQRILGCDHVRITPVPDGEMYVVAGSFCSNPKLAGTWHVEEAIIGKASSPRQVLLACRCFMESQEFTPSFLVAARSR